MKTVMNDVEDGVFNDVDDGVDVDVDVDDGVHFVDGVVGVDDEDDLRRPAPAAAAAARPSPEKICFEIFNFLIFLIFYRRDISDYEH